MKATTAAILGLNVKPRIPKKWADMHARLCQMQALIQARANGQDLNAQDVEIDPMDRSAAEFQRTLNSVTQTASCNVLGEISAAIRRIETNTFGLCEITGQPIDPERLAAVPWTRYSLEGQRIVEKETRNRYSLPGLQSIQGDQADTDEDGDEAPDEKQSE